MKTSQHLLCVVFCLPFRLCWESYLYYRVCIEHGWPLLVRVRTVLWVFCLLHSQSQTHKPYRREGMVALNPVALRVCHSSSPKHNSTFITIGIFTITAEIHAQSLDNFYGQYADRHMNLKFMWRISKREREIWQFVIVKNKLMSVFNAPVLLLTVNFVTTLSK